MVKIFNPEFELSDMSVQVWTSSEQTFPNQIDYVTEQMMTDYGFSVCGPTEYKIENSAKFPFLTID